MTEERIKELIQEMTLEEKIGMIHGEAFFRSGGVERLGIPKFTYSDGPMGVRPEYEDDAWEKKNQSDDRSSYLMSNTALASTFNREIAYQSGQILGSEARARGKDMILGPGVNIQRSPLCGRNFEYMSEDPYLSGEMAASYVRGVQENDVSACVKHYALNNQETARNHVDTLVSDRALHEIYLPAFKKTVAAGTDGIMGSYNRFRGQHCSQHALLVDEILRKEWGYDGILVSDWGSVTDTIEGGNSGIDVDMRTSADFDDYPFARPLRKAVEEGTVPEEKIDEKVLHILTVMNRLHMLDGERRSGVFNAPSSQARLLEAAEESVVLLKNEGNALPLQAEKVKKLLVIGDNADRAHALGGGSAEIKALFEITPLLGLKMLLGGNTKVSYEPGYYSYVVGNAWGKDENSQGINGQAPIVRLSQEEIEELNVKYLDSALCACKDADAVIFIGGLNHDSDVEGKDREDMKLLDGQDHVISELLKVRPDMVVVMLAGSPVDMQAWSGDVKSLLTFSYNGMYGGLALAKVLFGQVNPSGKLPVTFPVALEDAPAHKLGEFGNSEQVEYLDDVFVGYRYFDTYGIRPAFAFGHGLSYTDFSFGPLEVNVSEDGALRTEVSVDVTNTGSRDGKCTVLFFTGKLESDIPRPEKELKGFEKKLIPAGGTVRFSTVLEETAFAFYDEQEGCFHTTPGRYCVCAAYAADDVRSVAGVQINGEYRVGDTV